MFKASEGPEKKASNRRCLKDFQENHEGRVTFDASKKGKILVKDVLNVEGMPHL